MGSGKEIDQRELGAGMRRRREALCLSMSEMARRVGSSAAYLSDLERGNRKWNRSMMKRYEEQLEAQERKSRDDY
jgi:transcriptional regulator with XRE-family HTH domain